MATARTPGAVATIELLGDITATLSMLTGPKTWDVGQLRLTNFGGIDDAIVGRVNDRLAYIMPHGGLRIVSQLIDYLRAKGLEPLRDPDPFDVFPEADDRFEALALSTLSQAQSRLAVDLLLDQPRRWRQWIARPTESLESIRARSATLNRLVHPATIVVVGPPNVGKSTLLNALAGRSAAITDDASGTTRDAVGAVIDLAGVTVWWYDTPGVRITSDPIEARAIELARMLIGRADVIIAATEPGQDWPEVTTTAQLRVMLKSDRLASTHDTSRADIAVSVRDGDDALEQLVSAVRECVVSSAAIDHPGPWLFDERLIGAKGGRGD